MVLEIDSAASRRLQRVKLGESITVTRGGIIKPKGRSQ
jgi:antitoxin (DNA-binding transcriptional repressor) of toxin-antitoxin stability system